MRSLCACIRHELLPEGVHAAPPGDVDAVLSPAAIGEIVAATGWQPHTVRGAIAGALKKKLGLDVTSEKVEGRGRVYRIGREA